MSKVNLDLKGYKHVSSDDKSTTLKHGKHGHEIKIQHNALSKSAQAQLKALGQSAKNAATEVQKQESQDSNQYGKVMNEKGGKAVPFAEGGGIGEMLDNLADKVSGQKPPQAKSSSSAPKDKGYHLYENYAEGGEVENALKFDAEKPVEVPTNKDLYKEKYDEYRKTFPNQPEEVIARSAARDVKGINQEQQANAQEAQNYRTEQQQIADRESTSKALNAQNAAKAAASVGAETPSVPSQEPQLPQEPVLQGEPKPQAQGLGQPTPQQAPATDLASQYAKSMSAGLDTQMQGLREQAKAEGDLGKQQADIFQRQQEMTQDLIKRYDTKQAQLEQDLAQHEQDIKDNHIDPNKYWTGYTDSQGNKVSGHSKLAAAIGMLIAGFQPTGKPNAAIELIQKQIDRSVDAQKANLQSANNLMRANLDHFKNVSDATNMTKAMMIDAAAAQINQAAATAKSPMAQAMAKQAIGPLMQQKNQLMFNMALNQTVNDLATGNPSDTAKAEHAIGMLRQMNMPDKAKELSERVVPGVGVATIPVPQATRDKLVEHQELNKDAQYLKDFIKNKSSLKGLNPMDPDVIKAKQMVLSLQSKIREGKLGTVYKEGEQPLLDKFVNENPLTILGKPKSMPALDELLRSNNASMSVLKKSVGIKSEEPQKQDQQPVKGKDGKMYIRQGNYYVPYKGQ